MNVLEKDHTLTADELVPVDENQVEKAINEKSEDNYYVFTINDDGFRTAVDVTIGETVDGYTIIKSGLKAGEQVTVN